MKEFQQVAVSGFILNEKGEILMVKRADDDDFLPGYWEVPGGGTDFGEHPLLAVEREIKEETGLDVEVGEPFHVDDYFMEPVRQAQDKKKIHRVEIFFVCRMKDINQKVELSNEHSEYRWVSVGNVSEIDMTDYQQKAIKAYFERD